MTKTLASILSFLLVGGGLFVGWKISYPEKSKESVNSAEAIGSVALSKTLKAMEEYVGKADVTLEHYKRAQKEKREALVSLKTLRLDMERKAAEAVEEERELKSKGKDDAAVAKKKAVDMYAEKVTELKKTEESADEKYKDFKLFYEKKKVEIEMLSAKLAMLKTELGAVGSGEESLSLKKAKELEDEMKSACSKLEAQIEVYSKE